MHPIIGRQYWPNKTLRQMPRGWYLSAEPKEPAFMRRRWYQTVDTKIFAGIIAGGIALAVITAMGIM